MRCFMIAIENLLLGLFDTEMIYMCNTKPNNGLILHIHPFCFGRERKMGGLFRTSIQ